MPKKSNSRRTGSSRSSNQANGVASQGIERPTEHDVLQGRGGQANNWIGNKTYRATVDSRKAEYVQCERAQKTAMSRELVRNWRSLDPPGRFLEQDSAGLWHEIGDKKARRKTSQLLREDAPTIRKGMGLPDPQQPRTTTTTTTTTTARRGGAVDSGGDDNDNSGTDTTEDSQEEEWLPKWSRKTRRRVSTRKRKAKESKEPDKDLGILMADPKAGQTMVQEGPAAARRPSYAPTKKKQRNTTRKTTAAKGPSSMSKRDLYLAATTTKKGKTPIKSEATELTTTTTTTTSATRNTTAKLPPLQPSSAAQQQSSTTNIDCGTAAATKLPPLQPSVAQQQSSPPSTTTMMEDHCFKLPTVVSSSSSRKTKQIPLTPVKNSYGPSLANDEDQKPPAPLVGGGGGGGGEEDHHQEMSSQAPLAEEQNPPTIKQEEQDSLLVDQNPTIKQEEQDSHPNKMIMHPAAGIMDSEEDAEPLPIDHTLPPMVPEADTFGNSTTTGTHRELSWSSISPFVRPLLDDAAAAGTTDTNNFALLGEFDPSDLDNFAAHSGGGFGASGEALEPLDFEIHQATTSSGATGANTGGWEGNMDHIMLDEDHSGRRYYCGDVFVIDGWGLKF